MLGLPMKSMVIKCLILGQGKACWTLVLYGIIHDSKTPALSYPRRTVMIMNISWEIMSSLSTTLEFIWMKCDAWCCLQLLIAVTFNRPRIWAAGTTTPTLLPATATMKLRTWLWPAHHCPTASFPACIFSYEWWAFATNISSVVTRLELWLAVPAINPN